MLKRVLMIIAMIPTIAHSMLMPTARQLARVAAPLTVASNMRQNLHLGIHDTDLSVHKRWYAATQEEMPHANSGADRAALEQLLQTSRYNAYECSELRDKSANFSAHMLVGYGVIAGGVFGLTGCTALVEALVFGTTEPHFFAFLFTTVMPTVVIGGSPAGFLGIGAHVVSKIADRQERRHTEKAAELSRSLQLLDVLAAAEKKASATDETKKTDA